jgi:hypothetical protein
MTKYYGGQRSKQRRIENAMNHPFLVYDTLNTMRSLKRPTPTMPTDKRAGTHYKMALKMFFFSNELRALKYSQTTNN